MSAISLNNVGRAFGALRAVADVSLNIAEGERRAIIGPNGAGKTTLFNLICGDFSPSSGSIFFFDKDITRLKAYRRARSGIGRTYQNSILFDGLSVAENLYLAVRGNKPYRLSMLRARSGDPHVAEARQVAERVRIDHLLDSSVRELSHGQRRQLEVGMALASNPRLLMLDEPAAGLSPGDRPELLRLLQGLPRSLTLILIEHDMDIALPAADIVTVMKDGKVVVEATPDRIGSDAAVQEIYLGAAH